ncbi:Eukaryotic translation elongation factor IF5A [Orpheovirus IHUMI-LCC2]|uniref:Eukaryotic translation elongation factor IF5A n=1 Tax=Orpheovirus IHUMI-LCC2 TaxID=2023057 RepID=A0A2I2L3F7_9VIRU|nr:Eukaryotic translation elongation factor IF5A [Orpheovirus IHUMI-LCC2]SNW62064.1 Eukaryotic translation elongation factor IF5A [Orpheovirus IHUMI-LCC2]
MENSEYIQAEGTCSLSYLYPVDLRKGTIVIIHNRPCKVIDYTSIVNGKHGTSKTIVIGIDIFNGNKYEISWNGGDRVTVVESKKENYDIIDIVDEYLILINDRGLVREDLKILSEILSNKFKTLLSNTNINDLKVQVTKCYNIEEITNVM